MNQPYTDLINQNVDVITNVDIGFKSPQLKNYKWRIIKDLVFKVFCYGCAFLTVGVLAALLFDVFTTGVKWLDWQFLTSFSSRFPHKSGIYAGIVGSLWLISMTVAIAVPLGVGAALYLEELSKVTWWKKIIDINIANLAGVPSIVYGILGLALYVRFLGLGRSIFAGSLTLATLILPVIIIVTREALKAVPQSVRHAAYAVGATKWQTLCSFVLPSAFPGILTGIILSVSRAIGETAPIILVGGLVYVAFTPEGPMDEYTVLPLMIYNWAERHGQDFFQLAAAGIIVLLFILLITNALAIYLRHKLQKGNICQQL